MSVVDLEVRLACEDLMQQSYRLVDDGHASRVAELFTQDGRFMVGGSVDAVGKDSLTALFAAREADKARRTRHCLTNLAFERIAPDKAQVRATLMLFVLGNDSATTPSALADVEDLYRREGDNWMIAARTTRPL